MTRSSPLLTWLGLVIAFLVAGLGFILGFVQDLPALEVFFYSVATFAIIALLTGLTAWYRPGGRLTKEAIVAAHEKLVLSSVAPAAKGTRTQADRTPSPRPARGKLARR